MKKDEILEKKIKGARKAAELAGSVRNLSRLCNVSPGTVSFWMKQGIPIKRVIDICNLFEGKINKEELAPDFFEQFK